MSTRYRTAVLVLAIAGLLAACGSEVGSPGPDPIAATSDEAEDHADEGEDHEGEDHADEGEDHEGEDHEGEDHEDEEHHDDDHDDDDVGGGLGAHEHGGAELAIALNDGEVFIDLLSPTFNIFGFEYEPESDDDVAFAADRTDALSAPGVLEFNSDAECRLVGEVETELEFEGSHSEMTASWLFECQNPDNIETLDATTLFAEFPNFDDIDAQWVLADGQSAAELTPSAPVLDLQQ